MKKIFILIVYIFLCLVIHAQLNNDMLPAQKITIKQPEINYLQKSRHQKTVAWVLLGGGLTLSATSLIIATTKATEDVVNIFVGAFAGNPGTHNNYTSETVFFIGGTAAVLASIPFFIAASKNKRKGISLSFKNEMIPQIQKSSFVLTPVPSLTLKINL